MKTKDRIMKKKHRRRLGIAATFTAVFILTASLYLCYRAWDYWSADQVYDALCNGAVIHVSCEPAGDANDYKEAAGNKYFEPVSKEENGLSPDASGQEDVEMPVINWQKLKKDGTDIVAWLEIPALGIGYPVVQGEDNEFYLHHLPNGEYKRAGSLFMEAQNDPKCTDVNTIIYGHNMNDGSMFGKFRSMTQEDYERNPWIWLCTTEKTFLYRICSVHISHVDDRSYTLFGRGSEADWRVLAFISEENARSYLNTPIPKGAGTRILTLSTCASMSDERRVMQGIYVGEYTSDEALRPDLNQMK